MRTPSRILVSALVAAGLTAGVSAPAQAVTTPSERSAFNYINQARTTRGLHALRLNTSLSVVARAHSASMAAHGTIFHTSDLAYTLRNFDWTLAGENVGMGPGMWSIQVAFMNSPKHRDNELYKSYRSVGIGVVWRENRAFITVQFLNR